MSDNFQGPDDSSASRFQLLQPNRDLQSNWEVDLAKKLEEYLLKICSGELSSSQDHDLHSVNFAEAALLLQGSVQIYSRKVEYLYSLVLHALEYISQKRQNKDENGPTNADGIESNAVPDDDNALFLGLDDVPVEAKNLLDNALEKTESLKNFAKPPANLLVLEGDCLDSNRDGSELESYLLATCNFYGDFLLLDPCDAKAVYNFSRTNDAGKRDRDTHAGSSIRSKTCCSPLNSPTARYGGTAHKSNLENNQGIDNITSVNNCAFEANNGPQFSKSHADNDDSDHDAYHVDEPDLGFSNQRDESDDDEDDPWKPLNPHEPGKLKIKPFKRVKEFGRHVTHYDRCNTQASRFPIAKLEGLICPEFAQSLEVQNCLQEKLHKSQPLPLFEKLRRTFSSGEQGKDDGFCDIGDDDENEFDYETPDFTQEEISLPNKENDTDEVPHYNAEQGHAAGTSEGVEAFEHEILDSHTNLEDLCRLHLDALLASIAETQKQTEMAARVSTWKQRVEDTLEEQESRPPFDIHLYGERILDKFSLETENGGCISFSNVVKGQPKHEVARTFSALLQLVNNGNVDLQNASVGGELICHTAKDPFLVRLCGNENRRGEIMNGSARRKRLISPIRKGRQKSVSHPEVTSPLKSAAKKGRSSVKLGKVSAIRRTPDGKRRRRSTHLMEPSVAG